MKILITGSSGYVGYVLSKYFSEKGILVVGLDVVQNHAWSGNDNFKFVKCDVRDVGRLRDIFVKEQPTHVIHLAFLMNPLHDVKKEYAIDVTGSKNVFHIADETESVKQFVKFGSASAYGAWKSNKLWISEEHELRPRDYRYGINKKIIEEYYGKFDTRMKLINLRMCTAIGPLYHKKGGVVSLLVKAPFLLKLNDRYCELQFIHEDDLNALMNLIMNDSSISGTYNLAPDSFATIKQLSPKKMFVPLRLGFMRGIIGVLWKLRLSEVRPAAMTLSTYGIIVSPKKLVDRYKYEFKYSTLEGFRQTVRERKRLGSL